MTTLRLMALGRARGHQVDRIADGLQVLHVGGLDADAVLLLDDLGQLDQVERVDVERLEGGVAGDLVGLGAEASRSRRGRGTRSARR